MTELDLELSPFEKDENKIEEQTVFIATYLKDITGEQIYREIKSFTPCYEDKCIDGFIDDIFFHSLIYCMEGSGFNIRYWLCNGLEMAKQLIKKHHSEGIAFDKMFFGSDKRFLNLYNYPVVFMDRKEELGNCLLLVSDISKGKAQYAKFNFENFIMEDDEKKERLQVLNVNCVGSTATSPPHKWVSVITPTKSIYNENPSVMEERLSGIDVQLNRPLAPPNRPSDPEVDDIPF